MTKLINPAMLAMLVLPAFSQAPSVAELKQQAEQGNPAAQFGLGSMHLVGEGLPQNYTEAAKWFRMAADQGYAHGQFSLGLMYRFGQGVPLDYIQAHMWSELAASKLKGEAREKAVKLRNAAAESMTREQIDEAQRLATEWKPKTNQ